VEGEVGYFRRNHWVPLPQARDLDELNAQLLAACRADRCRQIAGREQTVGAAMLAEQEHLLPLAAEPFDLAEVSFPRVDGAGCVRVKTNLYSTPAKPGTVVEAKVSATVVEIWYGGRRIADHERCHGRQQQVLDLEHYLDVLEHKPGALPGSTPLEQWRRAGRWPASFDRLWESLNERHGRPLGTKQMIELLQLGRRHGYARLIAAVEQALQLGCTDAAAVRYFLTLQRISLADVPPIDVGALSRYERPLPSLVPYDALLQQGAP
jgi:hypothetical protein